jgi:hypothetical protein
MQLKSFDQIPVTKSMILHDAEKNILDKVVKRKIRNRWQLRQTLCALGALGQALAATETVKVLEIIFRGSFVPHA